MAERSQLALKAAEAAERLDRARQVGVQLSLIPAPASPVDPADIPEEERAARGRPKGSRNKRTSKLREMLAARGFRMPEDVLAELAGLSSRGTGVELAMERAEQVLLWAFGPNASPTGEQRLTLFRTILGEQARAATALLPFGLERLTPDVAVSAPVTLVLPGQRGGAPGDQARVIEGSASAVLAPPPMPGEIVRNQQVSEPAPIAPDATSRTE